MAGFVHLHVHTEFSLLDGGSDSETLARAASLCGMKALAKTDHNTLAGCVRFVESCEAYGIKPILGCEITLEDETHLTLLAKHREGYANLCRLISESYEVGGRLTPHLPWAALEGDVGGLFCLSGCHKSKLSRLVRDHRIEEAKAFALELAGRFDPGSLYVELMDDGTPGALPVARRLARLAQEVGLPCAATANVHYAAPEDSITHEVLRCIATHTTVNQLHKERPMNDERWLKPESAMRRLFRWHPEAVENTARIAEQCCNPLPRGEEVTPAYQVPEGYPDAPAYLRHLVYKGAKARYRGISLRVQERLDYELEIIERLGFVDYFLMVWRVVLWARRQGIRCTGRGSAADSCVAYALALTDVDVLISNLPFARFLAEGKTPDIDIDFDSARRDEVFIHIQETYGERNAAMVCAYNTFRGKSSVRDIGKALGLPEEALKWFTKHLSGFIGADQLSAAFDKQAELRSFQHLRPRFELLFSLCSRIANFPRHLQTHSSGIVISRTALDTLAPLQGTAKGIVQICHLDKDEAEEIGLIKFDVLGLRILSAVTDAVGDIRKHDPGFSYDRIPLNDRATFARMRAGENVGVFQFESAAQINLAQRLQIETLRDLIAAVALIRPGPVKGDAVRRFLAVRNGWERVQYLHPCLAPILRHTLGVIIFQEQVVAIFSVVMGMSEAEADRFRKGLTKHMKANTLDRAKAVFFERAAKMHPDLGEERTEILWSQLESWYGYGFTEGHAHSFALTGYKTAVLARTHPAAYFAGIMSNQPMGYYSNNTLAAQARRDGVQIRPVDVNASRVKCFAEEVDAIRLGFCLIHGISDEEGEAMVQARSERPFASLVDFCARVPLHRDKLESLILGGAFDSLHDHRRGMLWGLPDSIGLGLTYRQQCEAAQHKLAFGDSASIPTPIAWEIRDFSPWSKFLWQWQITGITAEAHAMAHLRDRLATQGIRTTYEAKRCKPGTRVAVAGLNIQPHRPPTKSGEPILFTSIEDEHGIIQATVVGQAILETTLTFLTCQVAIVEGTIQRAGRGAYIMVESARPIHMQETVESEDRAVARIPSRRTYTGTVTSGAEELVAVVGGRRP